MPEAFVVTPDMMSVLGCGEEDLTQVLRSLGFRERKTTNEAGAEIVQWQTRPKREERRPKPRPNQQQQHHRPKRASTITAAPYGAPATDVAAKPAEAQQPPRHEHKRKDRKGGERDDKPRPQRRPDKPFVVDPDSPFAALAALKFRK
jgi:hypothetical protein